MIQGKRIRTIVHLCLLGPVFFTAVSAQQVHLDKLVNDFNTYREFNFQEKVFLHLDRPSYLTGETMHFSVYLVDAVFHKPATISTVVYIEVMDRTNTAVLKSKIEMKEGAGRGMLFLPATLSSDYYRIRAYTHWMKNYDPAFYFHRVVAIVNPFRRMEASEKQQDKGFHAQFFPEGGNLITDTSCKVAYRVADADDTGIDFTGFLLDQHSDTITVFKPHRFGIGNFEFTPLPGSAYSAVITDRNGRVKSFALPTALEEGYAMKVTETPGAQVLISITRKSDQGVSLTGSYIFIHARNSIFQAMYLPLVNGNGVMAFNRDVFPEGISHITVFNEAMVPVCERLYFRYPENLILLKAKPGQKQYGIRRPVDINVSALVGQKPVQANLSVSVYKLDSFPQTGQNMVNYLWLTSDLKGDVESPEYYFESSKEARMGMDNLMLTHGWRRFKWNELKSQTTKAFMAENNGHILKGKVLHKDGSPAAGVLTYLASPGKSINLYPYISTDRGEIFYQVRAFTNTRKLVVQTHPAADSTLTINIDSPFSTAYDSQIIRPLMLLPTLKNQLQERSISMQIADIYDASPEPAREEGSTFYGKADASYLLDAYTRFPVMEEVMREYVPGVLVRKRKDGFQFLVLDNVHKSVFRESPLILLDGVPVFDEDEIMNTDPLLIRSLEVVQRKWYLGPLVFSGIVSYSTYSGDLDGIQLNPRAFVLDYEGLQQKQEFFSPAYDNQKGRDSRLPDHRTMLYWNPGFTTDSSGNAQLKFYTSDVPSTYKIVIEGITQNGQIGSATEVIVVKK